MFRTLVASLTLIFVLALGTSAAVASDGASRHDHSAHATTRTTLTASDLRVTLNRLLAEHAVLAMNATNAGVTGSKSFPSIAKALDRNSVALAQAIGSIYGPKAQKAFLDGKFQWRDHVRFFVDYTVALAKKDTAGMNKAVANLKRYTVEHGKLLAGATGLPVLAVQNDLLGHVFELKGQLDAYAAGNYPKATKLYTAAVHHMHMTGDLLAGAIAKQQNLT